MSKFPYQLDEKIVRENLLYRHFPDQRNIVTIEDALLLLNLGNFDANCLVIQLKNNFIALENYHILKWCIELYKLYHHQYAWHGLIDDILDLKIPLFKNGRINSEYRSAINDIIYKFGWKRSIFTEKRIKNFMSNYWDKGEYNIDAFIYTVSLIAETSDHAELYHPKSGYISTVGYFKRDILKDALTKIIAGIIPILHEDSQGFIDIHGYGHKYWRHGNKSDLVKLCPKRQEENLDEYVHRIEWIWARIIAGYIDKDSGKREKGWYDRQKGESGEMARTRIDNSIAATNNIKLKFS